MDIEGLLIKIRADLSDLKNVAGEVEKALLGPLKGVGDKMMDVGKGMTLALTAPLVGLGAISLKTFGEFEASMKRVEGLSGATGAALQKLTDQAIELGIKTQFSAKDAADAMAALAAKGFEVNQIYGSMPGVLALAAAGQIKMGEAATIAAGVLKGFALDAKEMGRVTDVIAKAAVSGGASISELGTSFRYVGPIAAQAGSSIEEVAAALSIMAEAGIRGQKGGTGLRAFFMDLQAPTKRAAEALAEFGIKTKDATGHLLPMNQLVKNLAPLLSDATAMQKVFGVHMSEIIPLLKKGADGFDGVVSSIKKAEETGFGTKLAQKLHEGWIGVFDDLKSSIETALIAIGKVLSGPVSNLVQNFLTPMVNAVTTAATAFGKLPQPIQTFSVAAFGIVAAVGPATYAVGKFISVLEALAASKTLTTIAEFSTTAFEGLAGAITRLGVMVAGFSWAGFTAGLSAIGAQAAALVAVGGPIALVAIGVAGLGAGAYTFAKNWTEIKATVVAVFSDIGRAADGAWESIKKTDAGKVLQAGWEAFKSFWIQMWEVMAASVHIAEGVIAKAIGESALRDIKIAWADFGTFLSGTWGSVVQAASITGNAIAKFLGLDTVASVQKAWEKFVSFFEVTGMALMSPVKTLVGAMQAVAQAIGMKDTQIALANWEAKLYSVAGSAKAASDHLNNSKVAQQILALSATQAAGEYKKAQEAIAAALKNHVPLTQSTKESAGHSKVMADEVSKVAPHLNNAAAAAKTVQVQLRVAKDEAEAFKRSVLNAEGEIDMAFKALQLSLSTLPNGLEETAQHTSEVLALMGANVVTVGDSIMEVGTKIDKGAVPAIERLGGSLNTARGHASDFERGMKRAWDSFGDNLSTALLKMGGFADAFKKLGTDMLGHFMQTFVKGMLNGIFDIEGALGRLSKSFSGIFGGGGGGTVPGGAPGVGGGGSPLSGMSSITSLVTGVGTLISSIVSNFQNARQEKTLNAIEESARYAKAYLLQMVGIFQHDLPQLDNLAQLQRLEAIEGYLANGGSNANMQQNWDVQRQQLQLITNGVWATAMAVMKPGWRIEIPSGTNLAPNTGGMSPLQRNQGGQTNIINVQQTTQNPYTMGTQIAMAMNNSIPALGR